MGAASPREIVKNADIAIIGGGFSGTAVAAQLLRQAKGPLRIAWIEKNAEIGRGVAYGTRSPWHLLNVPAGRMSAMPDQPGHFLEWLRARAEPKARLPETQTPLEDQFISRMIFGQYVQEWFLDCQRAARWGVVLDRHQDEAIAFEEKKGSVQIRMKNGPPIIARRTVLAIGNPPPSELFFKPNGVKPKAYCNDPWAGDVFDLATASEPVLLIGSGLTMVDVALELGERGHRGKILAVSRHGLLPRAHQKMPPELADWSPSGQSRSLRSIFREVRGAVRSRQKEGIDWRNVINSMRPRTQALWMEMNVREKNRFLRHLRIYWDVHRHRMPRESGDRIEEMRRSGQFEFTAGRILELNETLSGIAVRIQPRKGPALLEYRVARVINCTGPDLRYPASGGELISALRASGWITSSDAGIGIDVAPAARAFLHLIGPPRIGSLWETTAVPDIRGQAFELARELKDGGGPAYEST